MSTRQMPGQLELVFDVPVLTDDLRAELTSHVLPGWQAMGACRSVADDTWFPEPTETGLKSAAVDRCVFCPVRRSCLAYALAGDEEYGVWGGTTELQRDVLVRDLVDGASVVDALDGATLLPEFLWRQAS
ncbi:transcription factor WhiB [Kribbella sp. VKM Ac-2527]|uniref:Transcriptional regulator WhiB n=1 Tax=Kribbella caucasensis TaxID=2512215 RepID=A0A4R6KDE6_9ACTN|nr:WhiB family transcriptional regulator [Kribbella sp. VKM Ac-2527]TDO45875.1 transcription factor WhiB [Kribbella sp. VKM Ac-2527]